MYPTIREKKKYLVTSQFSPEGLKHTHFNIHGIDIEFIYGSETIRSWIENILASYQISPQKNAQAKLHIKWLMPIGLNDSELENFNEDPNPDLEIVKTDCGEFALQRDFSGRIENNVVTIYCKPNFDDGFYNALRWCLPRYLLNKNAVMLHSSCMVDDGGYAHLFIGPSGVGKTTTVSRIKNRLILGDDMILVSANDGCAFAETPVLGQNPKFKGSTGQKYPIASFNFLSQGDQVSKLKISSIEAAKKLFMSLMYPTWNWADNNEIQKISELSSTLLNTVPAWNLTLDLDTPFLGVVDGTI